MQHKKRFSITVCDLHGIRQYSLHQIIKKIVLYFILGVLAFLAIALAIIYYLDNSVEELENKRELVIEANSILQEKNINLKNSVKQNEIMLQNVTDKLEDIESIMGMKPPKDLDLLQRFDSAKLNSKEMAFMLQHIPSGDPVPNRFITSKFGWRIHPTLNKKERHPGIDLRAKMNTKIVATANGIVEYGAYHKGSGYGRLIIIDHGFGFKTMFGHLKAIKVKPGQFIKKGDLIGFSGSSGMSNGPHLHYEVRYIQRILDPINFMKWDMSNFHEIFKKEKKVQWQSLTKAINYQSKMLKQQ